MDRNKKLGLWVALAFVLGAIVTVVLTSQLDVTNRVIASSSDKPKVTEADKSASVANSLSQDQENLINQLNGVFIQAAKKVRPSIVTIYSEKIIKMRGYRSPFDLFFGDQFFNGKRPPEKERKYVQRGMGSGVIVKADGIILTNYHVVKGADDIRVKTNDGEEYEAEVVGSDPKTDLAIIRIEKSGLPFATLGDSDELEVGEWVLAIGNPFSEELRYTVTQGIVSAKGRKGLGIAEGRGYENFIQTDAAINPGNSGGALMNLHGEVVGINTAIISPTGGFAGVGFAIPINMASKVMNDLITKGKVVRGWLGVAIQPVDKDMARALNLKANEGVIVSNVTKNSPAEKAGIQPADVIVKFNNEKVKSADQLSFLVADVPPGSAVDVIINRDGERKKLKVTIAEMGGESTPVAPLAARNAEKIGIKVENLTQATASKQNYEIGSGVLITSVDVAKDGYRKGLREGDLIKEINRKKVPSVAEFNKIMRSVKPGHVLLLMVQRGKNNFFVAVEVPKK